MFGTKEEDPLYRTLRNGMNLRATIGNADKKTAIAIADYEYDNININLRRKWARIAGDNITRALDDYNLIAQSFSRYTFVCATIAIGHSNQKLENTRLELDGQHIRYSFSIGTGPEISYRYFMNKVNISKASYSCKVDDIDFFHDLKSWPKELKIKVFAFFFASFASDQKFEYALEQMPANQHRALRKFRRKLKSLEQGGRKQFDEEQKHITKRRELGHIWYTESENIVENKDLPIWVRTQPPEVWHILAADNNWGGEHFKCYSWISKQKNCDAATASTIFFLLAPDRYFDESKVQYRRKVTTGYYKLLCDIANNLRNGFYKSHQFSSINDEVLFGEYIEKMPELGNAMEQHPLFIPQKFWKPSNGKRPFVKYVFTQFGLKLNFEAWLLDQRTKNNPNTKGYPRI